MKICIVLEGSYPYVSGGVSTWTHLFISNFSEYEFAIISINAFKKDKGKYKYSFPDNVVEYSEIFLDDIYKNTRSFFSGKKNNVREKKIFETLIIKGIIDFQIIEEFLNLKNKDIDKVINGKNFLDVVINHYECEKLDIPFNEFLWTYKSMFKYFLNVLCVKIPEADIYHSVSTGYAGLVATYASVINNRPFVLTEHGIYSREREEDIIRSSQVPYYLKEIWINYFKNMSKIAYDSASVVTSLFEQNSKIQQDLGCNKSKIRVIPNGVNIDEYKNIIHSFNDDQAVNIGAIVRIVPIKDIITLLRAFKIAKEKIKNVKLYIIGPYEEDEDYYEECKSYIENSSIKDVIFTGIVDIKDYIGKMNFLVLTSISEGQPLVILEAFACKKAVISTDVGDSKALIYGEKDNLGKAGIITPIMDYQKISNAMVKLSKDLLLTKNMGEIGFKRVKENYTNDFVYSSYKNLYEEILR